MKKDVYRDTHCKVTVSNDTQAQLQLLKEQLGVTSIDAVILHLSEETMISEIRKNISKVADNKDMYVVHNGKKVYMDSIKEI